MNEEYKVYLNKFKVAVLILVASVLVVIFLIYKTIPEVQNIFNIQEEYKTQTTTLADAERKLKSLQESVEAKKQEDAVVLKAFFKPISGGTDTESVISDEFGEILQLMRENKIKARSLKYDYDPQDDNFVKNVGYKYHVCKVTAEMISNYANFENFLKDLYKHEHFLDILKIEILPYEKNKRILLINMQIKLYAQRDPSSVVDMPAPSAPADATGKAPDASQNKPQNIEPNAPGK